MKKRHFLSQKKFDLDGPDGIKKVWYDLRSKLPSFFSRHSDGRGAMFLGDILSNGIISLAITTGSINSKVHSSVLEYFLLPFAYLLHNEDFIHMQHDALAHRSRYIKDWFSRMEMSVLPWLAYSFDLNPIKNVWGILACLVYKNGKQHDTVADLTKLIQQECSCISNSIIHRLVCVMRSFCIKVIQNRGDKTSY